MDTDDALEVFENETKENIENLLRYYECDDSILVDSIKCMAGSRDGDNYMSVVKRVLVKGQQNNNQSGECISHFCAFTHEIARPVPKILKIQNIAAITLSSGAHTHTHAIRTQIVRMSVLIRSVRPRLSRRHLGRLQNFHSRPFAAANRCPA